LLRVSGTHCKFVCTPKNAAMLIGEHPIAHCIDHFYGYGSWDAKIWFIAHEEAGGDLPEEVAEKLNYLYDTHRTHHTPSTLCDIRSVYKHVSFTGEGPRAARFANLHDYRFGHQAVLHGIWKNLIAFAHGYRGETLPELLTYQQEDFVSPSSHREALINLYPLPSPHNHAWYYSWLDLPSRFSFLKSRGAYQDHLQKQRVGYILDRLQEHAPEVVLMYGMENINALKAEIQEHFPHAHFKSVKATKHEIPQHHLTTLAGTTVIVTTQTPALKHNRMETGFDWFALGKNAASEKRSA
jgi:hypothetical protein